MVELNYRGKISVIKHLICTWTKIHITPLGKIADIKVLLFLKIGYCLLTLPNPLDQCMKELHKISVAFLWDQKPDIINRKTICQPN